MAGTETVIRCEQRLLLTDIPLGFADSRIYDKDGDVFYDMWPAFGTQMTLPLRGAVSEKRVVRNTNEELVLAGRLLRYTFRFLPRQSGPDKLRYSVSILGLVPLGAHWGDISSDGKGALRAAFSCRARYSGQEHSKE